MTDRTHYHPNLIFAVGTQIVTLRDVVGPNGRTLHPRGSVGVVVAAPSVALHSYRIRFPDGVEEAFQPSQLTPLAKYKEGEIGDSDITADRNNLYERVIYRCVIGSRAYGLDDRESDTDRRGIYLPPADLHWSLYGVPEQLENDETQEAYWELQKFLVLALKANPNVLECLYTPLVEKATPLAEELLAMRAAFLSRLVYQTYNGYVMSQFKKMQADIRNQGQVKWKHVMHLIRLLISGIRVLREGFVPVRGRRAPRATAGDQARRDAVGRGRAVAAEPARRVRRGLVRTTLPERPDYEQANEFLIKARRRGMSEELP